MHTPIHLNQVSVDCHNHQSFMHPAVQYHFCPRVSPVCLHDVLFPIQGPQWLGLYEVSVHCPSNQRDIVSMYFQTVHEPTLTSIVLPEALTSVRNFALLPPQPW